VTEPLVISIVVTCYTIERLRDILELLNSIKAQSYPRVETIVVVEKSMELFDHVRKYAAENTQPQVKVVFSYSEPGLSSARNIGIKEAKGDIIAFVDDDALLFPDWAEETVKTYEDNSVIGVTGSIMPLWEDGAMDWFPSELDWILSCSGFSGLTRMTNVRNVYGTNMSFKREAFQRSGLFITSLGAKGGGETGKHELVGDETEISIRVRRKTEKRLLFNPEVRVRHRVYKYRVTPGFIARRAYWEGYTKALFNRNYRDDRRDEKLLSVEYDLLQRILTSLLPGILKTFFASPITAWRKFSVTVIVLSFVAIGYFTSLFHGLFDTKKTASRKQEA
jgi:glycosyltransferase involved in cell wall biosynthesis